MHYSVRQEDVVYSEYCSTAKQEEQYLMFCIRISVPLSTYCFCLRIALRYASTHYYSLVHGYSTPISGLRSE